jgi:SiaC family regulatory phosphoprotein
MSNINIPATDKSPEVILNTDGLISIKGKAIPDNAFQFFLPVMDWVDKYCTKPAEHTKIELALEYYNTSSSKVLISILKSLDNIHKSGASKIEAKWFFETDDDDMEESGQDFQRMVSIPISLISVESL